MSDQNTPEAVVNQALDAAGVEYAVGNLQEGTREAQVCLRAYTECVRQMLRGAHWDWARREGPLQLVADASGLTAGVGTLVPGGFTYSYNYPTDCEKVRFIPASYYNVAPPAPSDNIVPDNSDSPTMTGLGQQPPGMNRMTPSRFLIANDPNYVPDGASNSVPGVAPTGQTLICSNVQNAYCVYTTRAMYINLWDSLFRSAVVAYIGSQIAFPLHKDKKLGLAVQDRLVGIAQAKLSEARRTNGNEAWSNADLTVDWMRIRLSGGFRNAWAGWGSWGEGPGVLFGGVEGVAFAGNSAAF